MPEVIPAILANNSATAKRRLALIESATTFVQIDIMDGTMVPYTSWRRAEHVKEWGFDLKYELHLMVNDPLPIIHEWRSVPELKRVIIHAEIPKKLGHLIEAIHDLHLEVGIALSPNTPLRTILPHLEHADMVLVMGGVPGKSGQAFDAAMFKKTCKTVEKIRSLFPKLPIGFDIGVNAKTIPILIESGVDRCYAASAIFKTASPVATLQKLNVLAKQKKTS